MRVFLKPFSKINNLKWFFFIIDFVHGLCWSFANLNVLPNILCLEWEIETWFFSYSQEVLLLI